MFFLLCCRFSSASGGERLRDKTNEKAPTNSTSGNSLFGPFYLDASSTMIPPRDHLWWVSSIQQKRQQLCTYSASMLPSPPSKLIFVEVDSTCLLHVPRAIACSKVVFKKIMYNGMSIVLLVQLFLAVPWTMAGPIVLRQFTQQWEINVLANYNETVCCDGSPPWLYRSELREIQVHSPLPITLSLNAECNAWACHCTDIFARHTILDLTPIAASMTGKELRVTCQFPDTWNTLSVCEAPVAYVDLLQSTQDPQKGFWPSPYTSACQSDKVWNGTGTPECDQRRPIAGFRQNCSWGVDAGNCTVLMPLVDPVSLGGAYFLSVDLNPSCKVLKWCWAGGTSCARLRCTVDIHR